MAVPEMLNVDPLVNFSPQGEVFVVDEGSMNSTFYTFPSTSYSSTSISWNIQPSSGTVIAKTIWVSFDITASFTGTSSAGNLFQLGSNDALRYGGFQNSLCNNIVVLLNQQTFTIPILDILEPLSRYAFDFDVHDRHMSLGPFGRSDFYQNYSDSAALGTAVDPLKNIGEQLVAPNRSAYCTVLTNTPTSATVRCQWAEPLYVSPLGYGVDDYERGLWMISTLNVNMSLTNNVFRLFSHSTLGNNINDALTSFVYNSPPVLHMHQLSPKPSHYPPPIVEYPYSPIDRVTTFIGSVATGATVPQFSSQTLQLQSIPKRIFIYARVQDSNWTSSTPDTYLNISQISITFANNSGLLASADEYQLYLISRRAGLQMSYPQWHQYTGSVLCLEPAKDLSLPEGLAAGSQGQYIFQANITMKNISAPTNNYMLYIIPIYDGLVQVDAQSVTSRQGIVSVADVLSAKDAPVSASLAADYVDSTFMGQGRRRRLKHHHMHGGAWYNNWQDFKQGLRNVGEFAHQHALPAAAKALPVILSLLAAGHSKMDIQGMGYSPSEVEHACGLMNVGGAKSHLHHRHGRIHR